LTNYNATRAVGIALALPGLNNVLAEPTRTVSWSKVIVKVTSRLFTLMKQKVIFVYPLNQISNFSLT
jgi:hypothetical protein